MQMFLEVFGDLIVKPDRFCSVPVLGKDLVLALGKTSNQLLRLSGLNGCGMNIIGIIVMYHKEVFVPSCGSNRISTR